uniref:Uncharacterized protein n=1 Tax=Romanomermis culicivorax TaxID=13658 RepID=A0A915KCC9_ROMCU
MTEFRLYQYGHYRSDVYMGPVILGICAAIFALQIWFFLVVLGAFRYLHDKEIIGIHGDQMVKYAGGNV